LLPLDWSIPIANAPSVSTFLAPLARIGAQPANELPTWHAPSWYALAVLLYVAVAALLAVRAIAARVRLHRALASARTVANRRFDLPCPIVQHDDLGPMVAGLIAPRVVLPSALLAEGDDRALACVLRHEAAHLRRGDAWLSLVMQILTVVAWPVVPMWMAIERVRQLMELACDEAAIAGADATERRRYGHTLLDMAEGRWLVVAPRGAGELHFGSTLRARIEALASQRHWPLGAQALALALASIALLVACSGSTQSAASTAQAASKDEGYGYAFETDSSKEAAGKSGPHLPAGPDGRLPPETIQTTVRAHFDAFRSCYEAGLKKDPKLTGRVTVRYVFDEDGVTREASDASSTLPDKDVVACIVSEFRAITYPKTSGGNVTVEYPIELSP
jgi:beta-lactamase regulating signal transducer with metallopeptidase domain